MRLRSPWLALALGLCACAASNEPYTACRVSASCTDAAPICVNFRAVGTADNTSLCTRECAVNADCPNNGVCVVGRAGGFSALCMQRCARTAECLVPLSLCANIRAGDDACVPGN